MNMPRPRTPSQTVGPFFDFCLTPDTAHGRLFPDSIERIRLTVRVIDGAGDPVPDGVVEIWQACDVPGGDAGFGRLGTREDGSCEFDTVRPCDPSEGAAHINVCLFARGLLRHLYTRVYFPDDSRISGDPALALVPQTRRATLIARGSGREWTFDIHLQGPQETVFFDV
jgi:protocatechuate 3,4-dioxygenase alpha subunit